MKQIVKYCEACKNNKKEYIDYFSKVFKDLPKGFVELGVVGYYTIDEDENRDYCQVHPNEKLKISPLSYEEFDALSLINNDLSFIHAMEQLKEKDIIEFQLKMGQFKQQADKIDDEMFSKNKPKCPTCGSTNVEKISVGKKAVGGFMFGLFSSDVRKSMYCKNCGYKW